MPKRPPVTSTVTARKPNATYLKQLKDISPYVSRTLLKQSPKTKPTAYQKRRVREYWKALNGTDDEPGLLARVVYPVRLSDVPGKSRKRLKKLQSELGQPALEYLNVAFVETSFTKDNKPRRPSISWQDDKPNRIRLRSVTAQTALFNPDVIVSDNDKTVRKHVRDTLKKLPSGKKVTYHIKCGKYHIEDGLDEEEAEDDVIKLRNKYAAEDSAHYYGRWLFGITARTAANQKSKAKLRDEIRKAREKRKQLLKKAKHAQAKKMQGRGRKPR